MLDAVAPSNFLFTNPTAIKRAFDTAGVSLLKGARNFTADLFKNRGMPQSGRHERRSSWAAIWR